MDFKSLFQGFNNKNVLIVGNIGNGKSFLVNKLAGRAEDIALSKKGASTTTLGLNSYLLED